MKELDGLRECMLRLTNEYGTPNKSQKRNLWAAYRNLERALDSRKDGVVGTPKRVTFYTYSNKDNISEIMGGVVINENKDGYFIKPDINFCEKKIIFRSKKNINPLTPTFR